SNATTFGPNATTFVIPGEVIPTRFRSTGHGISAGMGKLGAIVKHIEFSKTKGKTSEDLGGDEDYASRQLDWERFRQNELQEKDENYD
ncbi:Inorganic phosphate transporter pho84, partial [Mortierella sp. AD032]